MNARHHPPGHPSRAPHPRARRKRLALQIGILAAALWFMVGCFYLPAKDKAVAPYTLPRDLIGPPGSGKPLILHQSTRDDVRRSIPRSLAWSPDQRYALHDYELRTGYTVWPLCFFADPEIESRYLQLRFDADGRLEGFDTFDDWDRASLGTGIRAHDRPVYLPASRPEPLDPKQEQAVRASLAARRQSETRPASAAPSH